MIQDPDVCGQKHQTFFWPKIFFTNIFVWPNIFTLVLMTAVWLDNNLKQGGLGSKPSVLLPSSVPINLNSIPNRDWDGFIPNSQATHPPDCRSILRGKIVACACMAHLDHFWPEIANMSYNYLNPKKIFEQLIFLI